MWTYIIKRLLLIIPTLFGITVVTFTVMHFAPGDPIQAQVGRVQRGELETSALTEEMIEIWRKDLHFDKPVIVNYHVFVDYSEEAKELLNIMDKSYKDELTKLSIKLKKGGKEKEESLERLNEIQERWDVPTLTEEISIAVNKIDLPPDQLSKDKKLMELIEAYSDTISKGAKDRLKEIGAYSLPYILEKLKETNNSSLVYKISRILHYVESEPVRFQIAKEYSDEEKEKIADNWKEWFEEKKEMYKYGPTKKEKKFIDNIMEDLKSEDAGTVSAALDRTLEIKKSRGTKYLIEKLDEKENRDHAISILGRLFSQPYLFTTTDKEITDQQREEIKKNWLNWWGKNQEKYDHNFLEKIWLFFTDTQYALYISDIAQLDFGRSMIDRKPVIDKIISAVKVSVVLMILSVISIYTLAIPMGIFSAVKQGSIADKILTLILFMLYSIPSYVGAVILVLLLSTGKPLEIFPIDQLHSDNVKLMDTLTALLDYLWHLVLPVACLTYGGLASLSRYGRTGMLDVIRQDYIRTARAKGLSEKVVIFKHALRNGVIPIITLFAGLLPVLMSGSFIIETIFSIQGMGYLSFYSITSRDYTTLMGIIFIDAVLIQIGILMSDFTYCVVDPRITFD